jgi:hypothetical protein
MSVAAKACEVGHHPDMLIAWQRMRFVICIRRVYPLSSIYDDMRILLLLLAGILLSADLLACRLPASARFCVSLFSVNIAGGFTRTRGAAH